METYVGKHRAAHQDAFYADEHGMKMMIWSAAHTHQYPIVRHQTLRKSKKFRFRKHGYGSWFKLFLYKIGVPVFDNTVPASQFI